MRILVLYKAKYLFLLHNDIKVMQPHQASHSADKTYIYLLIKY